MNKSNYYLRTWLQEIKDKGQLVNEPRTKWADGTPAKYVTIKQKTAEYDIYKGEFPINTLRPTALKGGFYDISAIYQEQTGFINLMDKSIKSWWNPFVINKTDIPEIHEIGQTYGHTVYRYQLMDKLLDGLLKNPFGRRHQIDLWQEQQMLEDIKALVPCVFLNMWSVEELPFESFKDGRHVKTRKLNLTLIQRSMDGLMTHSINPAQYVMLGMMICSHLNHHSEFHYHMGNLLHIINDFHIYDRHLQYIDEVLERPSELDVLQPSLSLNVAKDFYNITWEDFVIRDYEKPQPLSGELEIAI